VATAGGTPIPNKKEEQLTPYAIPNVPSIIWATNPISMNCKNVESNTNASLALGSTLINKNATKMIFRAMITYPICLNRIVSIIEVFIFI
jgi:hypothetical protein